MHSNRVFPLKGKGIATDRELIATALQGDECGFAMLLQRYRGRLLCAMQNQIRCPGTAEDIVQDAFAQAFINLPSFRQDSNFYSWLYRIALNTRRNYFRRPETSVSLDSIVETVQPTSTEHRESPDAIAQRGEDRGQVREALERLSANNKAILLLREFEGLDYVTISTNLKIRLGTVRSRLFRARCELRRQLSGYHNAIPRKSPS